jgi:hypothetical protein
VVAFVLPFWFVSGIGRAVWTRWYAPLLVTTRPNPLTDRNYLASATTKLGARNRVDGIRIATEMGWLWPEALDGSSLGARSLRPAFS